MEVYQALVEILRKENQIIQRLLELGREKQQVLKDAAKVSEIAMEEQALLLSLEEAEKERLVLSDTIAPGKTFGEWLASLDDPDVVAEGQALLANFGELRNLNNVNRQLIEESLAFVQFSLNLLVEETPTTYARQGTTKAGNKSFFDRKV